MPIFKSKTIQGVEYGLAHLDPFQLCLPVDSRDIVVEIAFSCHCFTEKWQVHHAPDLVYIHAGEQRAFNIERHRLSIGLPDIFRTLGTRSVYRSDGRDFFVLKDIPLENLKGPYLVFFDAFPSKKSEVNVRLNVTSAYIKPAMSLFASPIRFSTLIGSIAAGKKLAAGPKQQIKRK